VYNLALNTCYPGISVDNLWLVANEIDIVFHSTYYVVAIEIMAKRLKEV
jgi:hypothetical protein